MRDDILGLQDLTIRSTYHARNSPYIFVSSLERSLLKTSDMVMEIYRHGDRVMDVTPHRRKQVVPAFGILKQALHSRRIRPIGEIFHNLQLSDVDVKKLTHKSRVNNSTPRRMMPQEKISKKAAQTLHQNDTGRIALRSQAIDEQLSLVQKTHIDDQSRLWLENLQS